ncbi:Ubiquitin-activating enzyme E1 1, partial [Tetrabaena socialis]
MHAMSRSGEQGAGGRELDEELHSRQLPVYGREAMRRMAASAVLVCGANGLSAEVAKDVILAGVGSVTVHDTAACGLRDLSAQFFLDEQDVGRNRAEACRDKLQELNAGVAVHAASGALTLDLLRRHQAVVCTTASAEEAVRLDALCHGAGVAFIWAQTHGVFARVFTDFGPNFTVYDVDGEHPHTAIVASVSSSAHRIKVTCVDNEPLRLQEGELVSFSEVEGMDELNTQGPFRIRKREARSFELEADTSGWGEYVRGGIAVQVKEPKTLAFRPLEQALRDPGDLQRVDLANPDRPRQLHLAFRALDAFEAEAGRPPRAANAADATRLYDLAAGINAAAPAGARLASLNGALLAQLAHCAGSEISPMAAVFGGVVGQEVLKALSGRFHPILQWLYFDSVTSLPGPDTLAAAGGGGPDEFSPLGCRYDAQIAVFGRTMQRRLSTLRVFLVGAGALGGEYLKDLACMGVACSLSGGGGAAGGLLTVTDDDTVERSNLSRQFLFRDGDIGSFKSTAALAAARRLNPAVRVEALQTRVSPSTEDVFDDKFWQGLDLVLTAVDSVEARLYVDGRCVCFSKPLLDSGTLGLKCSTQVVIPHLTENYGAFRDPPDKEAPACTLRSFPYNIAHCLAWARSGKPHLRTASRGIWQHPAVSKGVRANLGGTPMQQQQQLELLESVAEVLLDRAASFEQCIVWARRRFQEYFVDRIERLTADFPATATTADTGAPFWSAPKRFPRPLAFDAADHAHAAFVQTAAILRAEVYGVPRPDWAADAARVAAVAAQSVTQLEAGRPKQARADWSADNDEAVIEAIGGLLSRLGATAEQLGGGLEIHPIQFEKDDDTNSHMDLIAGLANLRARNYSIPEVDRLQAKLIAGRITPAVATATAVAAGLACLELYKAVLPGSKVAAFRNTNANLALPLIRMMEPAPPEVARHNGAEWSVWDRWALEGDPTVRQGGFQVVHTAQAAAVSYQPADLHNLSMRRLLRAHVLGWFSSRGLKAYSISCGTALLHDNGNPKHAERLDMRISELVMTTAKVHGGGRRHLGWMTWTKAGR